MTAPVRTTCPYCDDGLTYREITGIMGRRLGLSVRAGTQDDAKRQLGFTAPFVSVDNPASSERTRAELGCMPKGITLADDLQGPAYFKP